MSYLKLFGIITIASIATIGITATLLNNSVEKLFKKLY